MLSDMVQNLPERVFASPLFAYKICFYRQKGSKYETKCAVDSKFSNFWTKFRTYKNALSNVLRVKI